MALRGRMVDLGAGGGGARGYLVEPEGEAASPALIVVHEWWGLNDHIKGIADRFAAEGYVALAPDLYEGKVAGDAEEAGRLMQGLDQEKALQTLDSAVAFLQGRQNVKGDSIGVTGFCMGGSFALLLPTRNKAIKAAAPFYGEVPPDSKLENLSAPVLFIGAENDPWITLDKMNRLKQALAKYGKQGEVKVYDGVGHAFFNDTRPEAYDREAAADAWQRVLGFFRERL